MPDSFKTVALLPMKAHSERVKGKNFRLFAGKPLFRWILDTLLAVSEIDKIVINTDARHILEENGLTESKKVMIRDRKKEICGDDVSMNLVIADDLAAVEAETYMMSHTTNPLLSSSTVSSALEAYHKCAVRDGKDSLFTVNQHQTRFYREDGSAVNHDPNVLLRTQDLEMWFEENSNLYIFTKESFKKTDARIGENPLLFTTPTIESADIDDATGWRIAEIIALAEMLVQTGYPPN
tara:strand:- start:821 stop:1531 length:711 start_codon:yes stop_codon:yes gene_type:complete